ncbi:MAG: hypothetical protein IPI30_11510 [Saprospiraceae bacterium]|nr:hypothetical protein [Candidatus Vicinibacter affinis]
MSNTDAFPDDRARIMTENALTATSTTDVLTTGGGSFFQGSRTLNVTAGDRICFEVNSDNLGGVDSLTISNLTLQALGAPSITVVGPRPGDELSCGTYFGAFIATNCSNLFSLCEFQINVRDTTKPLFTSCPDDIQVQLEPQDCGVVVAWNLPTASDPCPYNPGFVGPFAPNGWTRNDFF